MARRKHGTWMDVGIWKSIQLIVNVAAGFDEAIFSMMPCLSNEDVIIGMTIYSIWWKRNDSLWENCSRNGFVVARRAIDTLQDWRVVHQTQNTTSDDSSTLGNVKW